MNNLTAIILAAGYGSRIRDVTTNPKCLIKINQKTLLERHLDLLIRNEVKKVVIVLGYKKDLIINEIEKYKEKIEIRLAYNEEFESLGNTYSLYLGLKETNSECLILDADLIYEDQILEDFISKSRENSILVGKGTIDDVESAKVLVDNDGFVRMTIDKRAVTEEEQHKFKFVGEAMGILKFSNEYRIELTDACKSFLTLNENLMKNWEHIMNLFLLTHNVTSYSVESENWIEIDNKDDLEKAIEIFKDK